MKKSINVWLLVLTAFSCYSQSSKKDTITVDDYYIDFVVPDLSAFSLLGLSEKDGIIRPGNIKEFGATLSNIVGANGQLKPTAAVEYAPFVTLLKKNEKLWTSKWKPQNLAISLGTNNVDTLGTRLAFGFKWVIFDDSDPVSDPKFHERIGELLSGFDNESVTTNFTYIVNLNTVLTKYISRAEDRVKIGNVIDIANEKYKRDLREAYSSENFGSLRTYLRDSLDKIDPYKNLTPEAKDEIAPFVNQFISAIVGQKSLNDYMVERIKALKEDYKKRNWNAFVWQIGGGWVTHSPTGGFEDLGKEKFSLFTGVALPLPTKSFWKWGHRHSQIILQTQYTNDYAKLTNEKDRFSVGARILLGDANNRISFEGMYIKSIYDTIQTETSTNSNRYFRWAIGGEIKLSQGSWLEIAIGGIKTSEGQAVNEILPRFGLKHALQNKRRYALN